MVGRCCTYEVVRKLLVKSSNVEVQTLVDQRSCLRIFGVQRVALGVFVDQVSDDGAGFPDREAVVHQGGHCVLGVQLWKRKWFGFLKDSSVSKYLTYVRSLLKVPLSIIACLLTTAASTFLAAVSSLMQLY